MWNSIKSVKLSMVFTKVVMILVLAFAVALPIIKKMTAINKTFILNEYEITYVLPIIYACCFMALAALILLDQLLFNIKTGTIFSEKNVKILRRISWLCLIAALVLISGTFFSMAFLLMAVMSGFIGLVLRVVKNVFQAAVELKTENDYTI